VFVPTRTNIPQGGKVTWENQDNKSHQITSIQGEDFSSGTIEPGEEYSYRFTEEQSNVYVDLTEGRDNMSGAVIVGDVQPPDTLPSETDAGREVFSQASGDDDFAETRSMSSAVKQKEDMDVGFDD